MTSHLEQAVTTVHAYDYVSCIIITAIGYDYVLTFSKEVEYIWNKPWTRMSTLFVLARYSGTCSAILHAIWWNSAVNASSKNYRCNQTFIVGAWCFWIFICSADFVMILRLWALYARSRFILGTLLTLYAIEAITYFICYVSLDARFPHNPAMGTTRVLGATTCTSDKVPQIWFFLQVTTQLALGTWMCLLIVVQYVKETVLMYKLTKRVPVGEYQKLLMWEGLVYFIATLGFGLNVLLVAVRLVPSDGRQVLTTAIQQTLPFTLFPRLVLSLRRLYVRDLEGRRGSHMDTAFGFS